MAAATCDASRPCPRSRRESCRRRTRRRSPAGGASRSRACGSPPRATCWSSGTGSSTRTRRSRSSTRRAARCCSDDASGFESVVPSPPTTGSLRSTYDAKAGRTYFMFFGNPARYVKAGSTVTVTIGEFSVSGIPVTEDSAVPRRPEAAEEKERVDEAERWRCRSMACAIALAGAARAAPRRQPTGHEAHMAQMAAARERARGAADGAAARDPRPHVRGPDRPHDDAARGARRPTSRSSSTSSSRPARRSAR